MKTQASLALAYNEWFARLRIGDEVGVVVAPREPNHITTVDFIENGVVRIKSLNASFLNLGAGPATMRVEDCRRLGFKTDSVFIVNPDAAFSTVLAEVERLRAEGGAALDISVHKPIPCGGPAFGSAKTQIGPASEVCAVAADSTAKAVPRGSANAQGAL